jgi:ABC-type transport system involved in multi-copper enzyme maturation permease subunit
VAVHKRAYRPYEGPLTSQRWRFLVLPRFALMDLFDSRLLTAFMVFCFVPFLAEAGFVYLTHSAAARAMIGTSSPSQALPPEFFMVTLMIQGALAFLLTAWVAPVLVSPDLVNGALPLLLSRPLSRSEYVMGKAVVLAGLLSAITWVPVLALFGLEAGLADPGWGRANLRTSWAAFLGAWIWIAVLTLLGLALSSWIRWRIVASGALFGVFFAGSAFGEMWSEILGNAWGRVLNPSYLVGLVWRDLFGLFGERSLASEMLDDRRAADLPTWVAWTGLALMGAASVWLLERRLRAREVVS